MVPLHSFMAEKLQNYIFTIVNDCMDKEIERKLETTSVNSKLYYHNCCKKEYLNKSIKPATPESRMHKRKKFHKLVYYLEFC